MLLVSEDRLNQHPDTDFFAAAMYTPEIALLGNSLAEIAVLGPEAERKLSTLPSMTDDGVSSTIYELLVGAACVRKGLTVTMVPEDRASKVPDFSLDGLGAFPGAIECKRRLGLTEYEKHEAERIEALYISAHAQLSKCGIHGSIEARFTVPLNLVSAVEFDRALVESVKSLELVSRPWGVVSFTPLPYRRTIVECPLFSPDYLDQVFGWASLQTEWDGIVCQVDLPSGISSELVTNPVCLKWRSESTDALKKKARGIVSLWGKAIKQIPDGDIGFVYIAYPEGARSVVADARTRYILESMSKVSHRWSVRVPVTVISRLYARPLGRGRPDLIESVLPATGRGEEFWLKILPTRIFTADPDEVSFSVNE